MYCDLLEKSRFSNYKHMLILATLSVDWKLTLIKVLENVLHFKHWNSITLAQKCIQNKIQDIVLFCFLQNCHIKCDRKLCARIRLVSSSGWFYHGGGKRGIGPISLLSLIFNLKVILIKEQSLYHLYFSIWFTVNHHMYNAILFIFLWNFKKQKFTKFVMGSFPFWRLPFVKLNGYFLVKRF